MVWNVLPAEEIYKHDFGSNIYYDLYEIIPNIFDINAEAIYSIVDIDYKRLNINKSNPYKPKYVYCVLKDSESDLIIGIGDVMGSFKIWSKFMSLEEMPKEQQDKIISLIEELSEI